MARVKAITEIRWRNAKNSPELIITHRNKYVKRKGTPFFLTFYETRKLFFSFSDL